MVGEQMAETVGHAAKKRKGGDECADHKPGSAGLLRLPEIVATLAAGALSSTPSPALPVVLTTPASCRGHGAAVQRRRGFVHRE